MLKRLVVLLAALAVKAAVAQSLPVIEVYTPTVCLACIEWTEHLRQNGFTVKVTQTDDMEAVKRRLKIPKDLEAVPTGLVAGYFIEGHVHADQIKELLTEKPKARGLAVPGLPLGAPGREFSSPTCETACTMLDKDSEAAPRVRREFYETLLVKKDGKTSVYARH